MTDLNNLLFHLRDQVMWIERDADRPYGSIGTITQVDAADSNLTYMVTYENGDTEWTRESSLCHATDPGVMSSGDKSINELALGPALNRLRSGFATGEISLKEMEGLAQRALEVWRAEGSPATAAGVCSACMGNITFNTRTGSWDHEGPTEHIVPAVILVGGDQV